MPPPSHRCVIILPAHLTQCSLSFSHCPSHTRTHKQNAHTPFPPNSPSLTHSLTHLGRAPVAQGVIVGQEPAVGAQIHFHPRPVCVHKAKQTNPGGGIGCNTCARQSKAGWRDWSGAPCPSYSGFSFMRAKIFLIHLVTIFCAYSRDCFV